MALSEANWYQNWFGKDYLKVYSHRDLKDAQKLVELILSNITLYKDSNILDIGCGQGRHLSIFAEKQYQITGVDLSPVLLRIAKEKHINNSFVQLIQADMRQLPLQSKFDLVLNLFTSFGYFENDDENINVLKQINALIKDTGSFVIDYFNSDFVKKNLVPKHKKEVGELIVEQERYIEDSRIKKKINLMKDGKKSTYFESVKLYSPEEIFNMLQSVNLKINKTYGDYNGTSFNEDSPRLLVFGEKFE